MAKLHILFPRKLSGVATTMEIAWAGSSDTPATLTSSSSTTSANRKATTLTAKKRVAWDSGLPAPARKVQWRFHQKLLVTPATKASVAAAMWWMSNAFTHRANTHRFTAYPDPPTMQNLISSRQFLDLRMPARTRT